MGNKELKFRHEMKHIITPLDQRILRQRLNAVARIDPHAKDGVYEIRSLYFDNINDKALVEKVNGVSRREKFRIRYYNGDTGFITAHSEELIEAYEQLTTRIRDTLSQP